MKSIQMKIRSAMMPALAVFAVGLTSGCTDAFAQERAAPSASPSPSVERSAKVRINDLNLATSAGVKAAEQRIEQAARKLCDQLTEELDLGRHEHYVECIDRTTIAAMRQLNVRSVANLSAQPEARHEHR